MKPSKTRLPPIPQSGFTLIELMIVVAIIGILAAVAIPQYQDYASRSKWSDNITQVTPLMTSLAECIQNHGGQGALVAGQPCADTAASGMTGSTVGAFASGYGTSSMNSGDIVITGGGSLAGCSVTVHPVVAQHAVTWTFLNSAGCGRSQTGVGT